MDRISGLSRYLCIAALVAATLARAQGGKEFLEWLKEYSPTGYFVINDFETRAKKTGDHKQWLNGQTAPYPAVAVHECNHMRNGEMRPAGGGDSYFLKLGEDFALPRSFTPFNSKEMTEDIPEALVNFQTDVYISGKAGPGDNMYSQVAGIYGIFEEYSAYVIGLKSIVEMSACFKDHFNSKKEWDALGNDGTTSVWSNQEFRYFCLRYVLRARAKHPEVYAKIIADAKLREFYTRLTASASATVAAWKVVLDGKGMDTKTGNGFDWHWKFVDELAKQEYVDLEKILLTASVAIAPVRSARPGVRILPIGTYDALGRSFRIPATGSLPPIWNRPSP